jgi:cell wall-associated NlpC family hydrolase
MKLIRIIPLAACFLLLSGCITNPGDTQDLKQHSGPVKVQSNGQSPADLTEGRHIVPVRMLQNTAYVSLDDVTKATGYHGAWLRDGTYGVGDHDAAWTFRTAESTAVRAGKKIKMPATAVKEGNRLYVPVSGFRKLFGDVTVFAIESDNVAFFPKPSPHETGASGKHSSFADDPAAKPAMEVAISGNKAAGMLAFAKKRLGIKYEFGTEAYKKSGNFDCSSFTQYVYANYGVTLPRVAGQQAEQGTFVARDKLRVGDLLFFYVPGRYKSNKVVGHVGLYMGDGNMIHSSPMPKDGVQITSINNTYWKDTFLYSKRYITP